jgi:outer membrane protein TolC
MHRIATVSMLTAALIAAAAVNAGCATGSRSRESLQAEVAHSSGAVLRPDTTTVFAWPASVNVSDGLTADEAAVTALWNNSNFRASLAMLDVARASLMEAGAAADPLLSIVFPGTNTQWKGTLSWPVQLLQLPWRMRTARLDVASTVQNLVQAGVTLTRDARLAHSAVLLARERQALLQADASLAESIARIAGLQFDAGRISRSERERLNIAAISAVATRSSANREMVRAENALLRLLGLVEQQDAVLLDDAASLPTLPALAPLEQTALLARADLHSATLQLQRAGANVGWQRSQVVSFAATLDLDKQPGTSLSSGPGASLSLPILSGNRAGRLRATAAVEAAALHYSGKRQQVVSEVRVAHAALAEALATNAGMRARTLPAAQAIAEQLKERLRLGRESEQAVMQAERTLLSAQMAVAEAAAGVRNSAAQLTWSSGQGQLNEP